MDHQTAAVNAISTNANIVGNRITDRQAIVRRLSESQPAAAESSAAISDTLETSDRESSGPVTAQREPPAKNKQGPEIERDGDSGGLLDICG